MGVLSQIYSGIGERVERARKDAGVTQEELAEMLGLTRTSLSNFENGKQRVQIDTLYSIASYLCVDVRELLPPMPDGDQERMAHIKSLRIEIDKLQQELKQLKGSG